MKITITCDSEESSNRVYDLLIDKHSGDGCLRGEKKCIDAIESVPDVMQFELDDDEVEAVKRLSGVLFVYEDDEELKHHALQKINTNGVASAAGFNQGNNVISHSMKYCQKTELEYSAFNDVSSNYPSIDCSNVDVVVMDSGIDANHEEFKDENGNSNVVLFNWTLLKNSSGAQIVTSQSSNYYEDQNGHGTACASLIAGKRNGFAKNAKIFSLRENGLGDTSNGFTVNQCLELMLSFQRSKKLNLYGLNSSRPTVFSNSWGYVGAFISDDLDSSQNNLNFAFSIDGGKNTYSWNNLPGISSSADAYFRTIIQEGVHVLASAGNDNVYLKNNPSPAVNLHYFLNGGEWYSILRTAQNKNSFVLNNTYNTAYGSYVYKGWSSAYLYSSPNIGINNSKSDYPIIIVGDVCPIGEHPSSQDSYWSGGNIISAFEVLKNIKNESRVIKTNKVRYKKESGPFFIKSAYSSFGPDVDVYAPGNGAWAAKSSFIPAVSAPTTNGGKYMFFNGTSSSCPVVAGILATYLSQNPTATPLQSKNWLTSYSISGNIMETQKNTLPIISLDSNNFTVSGDAAFGSNYNNLRNNPVYRLQKANYEFLTADIEDVLFCNRFFDSNNLIPQAFPLRKIILNKSLSGINIGGYDYQKSGITSHQPSHIDSNLV